MSLTPHPQNDSFEWQERVGVSGRLSPAQIQQWNCEGYFLLQDVIPNNTITALIEAIDPFDDRSESFLRKNGGSFGISRAQQLTFSTHIVKESESVKAFIQGELFADLCLDLLGPDARLYWDQAVYKKPGNPEEFPWHQDNGYNFVEPQDYLTCWIPLTPATRDNGCPWVIPKVHLGGTYSHRMTPLGYQCIASSDDAIAVEAKPGDIVVFSSLTPHRTGPNLTDDIRKSYILQFSHASAEVVSPHGTRTIQDDPERQFLTLRHGKPVAP